MRTLIFAISAIAFAAQAQQNQPKSAQGPRPDPALSKAFADSVGSWTCKGKMTLPKEMGGGELDTRSSMTHQEGAERLRVLRRVEIGEEQGLPRHVRED